MHAILSIPKSSLLIQGLDPKNFYHLSTFVSDRATCSGVNGTYTCACNDGWAGDGFVCKKGSYDSVTTYMYAFALIIILYEVS